MKKKQNASISLSVRTKSIRDCPKLVAEEQSYYKHPKHPIISIQVIWGMLNEQNSTGNFQMIPHQKNVMSGE